MPRKCCVPGCKSNYESTLKSSPPISTFRFPKDASRRKLWLQAIPRKDWTPYQNAAVCIKHFSDGDIIKYHKYINSEGVVVDLLLRNPKLVDDAVPRIFENLPSYLSRPVPPKRKGPDERQHEQREREAKKVEDFLNRDSISNFEQFVSQFPGHVDQLVWNSKVVNGNVYFYILNVQYSEFANESLEIICSIVINNKLIVQVYLKGVEIPAHDLSWLLPSNLQLSKWSQIENLLTRYKHLARESQPCTEDTDYILKKAHGFLEQAYNISYDKGSSNNVKIGLILDQVKLLTTRKPVYDPSTIVFAFMMYSLSPNAYQYCREHFTLPHKRYLQHLASSLNVSPESGTTHYLSRVSRTLNNREKIVSLLIDEIYVNSNFSFKGQSVVGIAENCFNIAKTVVCFMITSCFGHFKEVVKLVPVNNLSGEQLQTMALAVITFVQNCGFRVLCVITDNNRVNQNMYKKFSSTAVMPNPSGDTEIFLTYDSVHILKNVRNNWINVKGDNKSFVYPDFNTDTIKTASFGHLRDFYKSEEHCLLKKAYKLNRKTLFPNNLERQNVVAVDNVFHHSTIAALKTVPEYEDTCSFLEIFRSWWDIVNSKSVIKGICKRNEYAGPIYDANDNKVVFLRKFLQWIIRWRNLNTCGLSKDTSLAIERSTSVLIQIIEYAFSSLGINYVLPGKFQTDKLEERFGQYRRLSGTNYNVSVREIVESEKKLRVRKVLHMVKESKLELQDMISSSTCVDASKSYDIAPFLSVLDSDYLTDVSVDESIETYVCGYASHKVTQLTNGSRCCLCYDLFCSSKGDKINDTYFDYLQRGGLKTPTDFVKVIYRHVCAIFQSILISPGMEEIFLVQGEQKKILVDLTKCSLEAEADLDLGIICHCGSNIEVAVDKIIGTFANILLNNYTKYMNVQYSKNKRKLQTFMQYLL